MDDSMNRIVNYLHVNLTLSALCSDGFFIFMTGLLKIQQCSFLIWKIVTKF